MKDEEVLSSEVVFLRKKLYNWKSSFPIIDYQKENCQGELSQIIEMLLQKDIIKLLGYAEEKYSKEYFELHHPEHKEIITRAVYNVKVGMTNFIFMIDKENRNPWIIAQSSSMMDFIITKNYIMKTSCVKNPKLFNDINFLHERFFNKFYFSNKKFAYLLEQGRPFHFFYDQLKYLLVLNTDSKPVKDNNAFFKIINNNYNKVMDDDYVYFFPTIIDNARLNHIESSTVKDLNVAMEDYVYSNSLINNFKKNDISKNHLKVWYGITAQKRSWIQQVDACVNIVKNLQNYFDNIDLYVDGMTALDGKNLFCEEDNTIFQNIFKQLSSNTCCVSSLIGKDYKSKIQICDDIDLFISNAGTGCIVPLRFCKKQGVLHSNTKLLAFPDTYSSQIKFSAHEYTIDVYEYAVDRADYCSYYIPWEHIYNLSIELLNEIKKMSIPHLAVPDITNIAMDYEKKRQIERKKYLSLSLLDNKIKSNFTSADILREVAVAFEQYGDIETALKIMKKALMLHPNGPFINKKVKEYMKIIQERNIS